MHPMETRLYSDGNGRGGQMLEECRALWVVGFFREHVQEQAQLLYLFPERKQRKNDITAAQVQMSSCGSGSHMHCTHGWKNRKQTVHCCQIPSWATTSSKVAFHSKVPGAGELVWSKGWLVLTGFHPYEIHQVIKAVVQHGEGAKIQQHIRIPLSSPLSPEWTSCFVLSMGTNAPLVCYCVSPLPSPKLLPQSDLIKAYSLLCCPGGHLHSPATFLCLQ